MASAMNGGDGTYSYSKNSDLQRREATIVKGEIAEEIYNNLDVKTFSSVSNTIRIADLGCSTGPNTIIAMQNVLEAIKRKHVSQNLNPRSLEFQVFFNDRTSNDFNTLFTSLPSDKNYFAAGVPGSFHGRLFPESSLHLVYSCYALQYISKIPEEVLDKNSPAWNKGRIFYLNAPREVYDAYRSRFNDDFNGFLNARAKEIVGGGMMVIITGGCPNGMVSHRNVSLLNLTFDLMGCALMDMAKEGLISETLVDSYNIPLYSSSPEEMIELVERNGHFIAEKVEFTLTAFKGEIAEISTWVKHVRAGLEGALCQHFGNKYMAEMFESLDEKVRHHSQLLASSIKETGQLFIVLKRR